LWMWVVFLSNNGLGKNWGCDLLDNWGGIGEWGVVDSLGYCCGIVEWSWLSISQWGTSEVSGVAQWGTSLDGSQDGGEAEDLVHVAEFC